MKWIKKIQTNVLLAAFVLLAFTSHLMASSMEEEIEHLFQYVAKSECTFERNASKHDAQAAAEHMKKKYEYYKDEIDDTEKFIELAATRSVFTRIKYSIHCPGKPEVHSGKWLLDELRAFRISGK